MIKQNQKYLNRLQVILDGMCILAAMLITWFVRFKSGVFALEGEILSFKDYIKYAVILIPVYLCIYDALKLYSTHRIKSIFDEFRSIIKANIFGLLIFTLILFLLKEIDYSRYYIILFGFINIIITILERGAVRYFLRKLRKKGKNLKHIVFVGFSDGAVDFINRAEANKHWGYNVIGIFDDKLGLNEGFIKPELNYTDEVAITQESAYLYKSVLRKLSKDGSLFKLEKLNDFLSKMSVDEVFITLTIKEYDKVGKIIGICEKYGVRAQIIPDYYKYIPAKPSFEEVDGIPIISIRYIPLDNIINKAAKRFIDIIISFVSIVVFSPIMVLTSLLIKLSSKGPIIFRQERVGTNKNKFMMYKFRSMKMQTEEDEKDKWTTQDDPRKTKFGQFIRKTSIDELPQLFNVLKGDMSIIGPRPERPYFVDKFKEEIPRYMVKHQVRPGMTGWAQVNGYRGDTSIEKRIEHDLYYIENWSIWLDIKILWFTVFKGFVNKNAY